MLTAWCRSWPQLGRRKETILGGKAEGSHSSGGHTEWAVHLVGLVSPGRAGRKALCQEGEGRGESGGHCRRTSPRPISQ